MVGLQTKTILDTDGFKAIVGIPDWATDYNENKSSRSASTPINAWANVPLLYRAISLRASSLSSVPFFVFKGEEEVEYPLEPDLASLLYAMELGLMLTGAAYALKQHVGRVLTGVQVLNPTTVKYEYKHGKDVFTQRVGNNTYGPFYADDMLFMREPSMTADRGAGLAPAQVALSAAQLRYNMQDFASRFFESGAMPTTLISTSSNPNVAEMERAQSFFKRRMTGVANAWRTLFLRGDLKVNTLTPDIKTMGMKELSDHVALDIGAALGVPRSILESDAANYATSKTDMQSFWHMTIRPRLPAYELAINKQLFAGTEYSLKFAPEQLDVFQEDESERAGSLLNLVNAGVPLDDAMLMLGYNPIENKPEPVGAPEVEVVDAEEDLVESELASWQRFAIRNIDKPNKRSFKTKHVPDNMAHEIRRQLLAASTAKEVRAAFEPRSFLGWQSYP